MNEFIIKELQKCRVPLPKWDNDTVQLVIPLHNTPSNNISDGVHEISIKNYILHEPPNFTLSIDWNMGTVPPESKMNVRYVDTRGKMTKVDGVGITTNIHWSGWLPNKSFEVI